MNSIYFPFKVLVTAKRTFHFWGNLVLVVFFSGFLVACAFHQHYTPNTARSEYSNMTAKQWSKLDKSNYLILHSGDQMLELFDITLDENTKEVSGKLRAFQGLPLEEYNRIPNKGSEAKIKIENSQIAKQAVKQVHFWLSGGYDLSKESITFHLNDVYFIGVSRNEAPTGVGIALLVSLVVVPIYILAYFGHLGGVSYQ